MKDQIDRIIRESVDGTEPHIEIDIRRQIMSRIKTYELKKERLRSFFQYALMFCTALASLGSLVFTETLYNRLRIFLLINHLNPLTLKLMFQGFFACALIGLFILMILALNEKDDSPLFSKP